MKQKSDRSLAEVPKHAKTKAIFEDVLHVLHVLAETQKRMSSGFTLVSLSRHFWTFWTFLAFRGEPGKTLSSAALISGATATVTLDTSAVRPARSYTLCAGSSVCQPQSHQVIARIIEAPAQCSKLLSWNHPLMATQNISKLVILQYYAILTCKITAVVYISIESNSSNASALPYHLAF